MFLLLPKLMYINTCTLFLQNQMIFIVCNFTNTSNPLKLYEITLIHTGSSSMVLLHNICVVVIIFMYFYYVRNLGAEIIKILFIYLCIFIFCVIDPMIN